MLSLDDINKRFAAPDGALPGLYGVRLASSVSLDVAGGHFIGGVNVRPINGHTLRRLVASGYPVAAAWRVTMTGADLMREVAGDERATVRKLSGEAEFFEGDVFASLPPTRLDEKPKKPKRAPKPPAPVFVMPRDPVSTEHLTFEEIAAARAAGALAVDAGGYGFVPTAWLNEHREAVRAATPPVEPAEPATGGEPPSADPVAPTEPLAPSPDAPPAAPNEPTPNEPTTPEG